MRIGIVIFDGFDELDVIGPLEVFRRAGALGAEVEVDLVTLTEQSTVMGTFNLSIVPDAVYKSGIYDTLLVVGGGWADRNEQGAWGEFKRGEWLPILKAEAEAGTVMLGVCTGGMLLAHAGIIGQRKAATHHSAWDDLLATGAIIVPERVVDEGALVTSGGVTSGIDLALHFVEREFGENYAKTISRQLEY